jgi:hypothetical protein
MIISRIQLLEGYPGTAAYVPGVQGECRNYHRKFPRGVNIFRNCFFSVKSVNLSFRKWVGLRVPNERSHPGDSRKNKFIFVSPKIIMFC